MNITDERRAYLIKRLGSSEDSFVAVFITGDDARDILAMIEEGRRLRTTAEADEKLLDDLPWKVRRQGRVVAGFRSRSGAWCFIDGLGTFNIDTITGPDDEPTSLPLSESTGIPGPGCDPDEAASKSIPTIRVRPYEPPNPTSECAIKEWLRINGEDDIVNLLQSTRDNPNIVPLPESFGVQPETLADVPPHCLAVTLNKDGNECAGYQDDKGFVYSVDGRLVYDDASQVKVVRPIGYIELAE